MKKKGKTKRIITICITVIMMLCVFVVPSNATTYQPAINYKITAREEMQASTYDEGLQIASEIAPNIELVLKKIYNVDEINEGDVFEYEEEKSVLIWTYRNITYTSTKVKRIDTSQDEGYFFYANSDAGEWNILFLNTRNGEEQIQVTYENGAYNNFYEASLKYANSDNIKIIQPTTFVEETTKGISEVLGWVVMPFNALINGGWNSLLVLFAVGIAISGVLIAVKIIRKFIWGD